MTRVYESLTTASDLLSLSLSIGRLFSISGKWDIVGNLKLPIVYSSLSPVSPITRSLPLPTNPLIETNEAGHCEATQKGGGGEREKSSLCLLLLAGERDKIRRVGRDSGEREHGSLEVLTWFQKKAPD